MVCRDHIQNFVAINHSASVVSHNHPISIAIKCNSEISTHLNHFFSQLFRIRRTCIPVDIQSIRSYPQANHLRPQLFEHIWRDVVSCAICAVENNRQVRKIYRWNSAFAKFDVTSRSISNPIRFTKIDGISHGHALFRPFHFRFNLMLGFVIKFFALTREKLDTVILKRIMGSGNNDARLGVEGTCQIGNTRCGHWPKQAYIHSRGRESCFQS